jgi:5-methylcytosine-specific restriction endonuclease McrA
MTIDKGKKKAVRLRMAETGEPYTEASRQIELEEQIANFSYVTFDKCANCDNELEISNQSLFCSPFCLQLASFVRYARGVTTDPTRFNNPETKYALSIKMAHLMNGGYPSKARQVPKPVRAIVIERDGGACRNCRKPGTDIDHITGDSNGPDNLQLLCWDCHKAKTTATMIPASPEHQVWANELYMTRILVDTPTRLCDDEGCWENEWRAIKSQRIRELWEQLESETSFTQADLRDIKGWENKVAEAYDVDYMPGDGIEGVWDDIDPSMDTRPGTEEEIEEGLYFRHTMEKDD